MDERYIAAVDMGSSKIAVSVARAEGNDLQIIYYRETPSEGVHKSYVYNPMKATRALKEAVAQAEKELGIKILQAIVGLPRHYVKEETATGRIERSNKDSYILKDEIETLKSIAVDNYPLEDDEKQVIYGAVAQSFSIEGYSQGDENEIIGMVSPTLQGNFKAFIGAKGPINILDKTFNDAGVAIARKYFTPEALSHVILTKDERENGVALIEFGAGVTSVCIYKNDILRHYSAIPFGGKTVTSDIKLECGISTSLAENLKLAFGACLPDKLASMSEKIIRINYDEGTSQKELSVKYLSEIITAREAEIVDAILYHIQESGYADELRGGVVITGGGAEMGSLTALIKERSGYNVRIGYPIRTLFTCAEGVIVGEASTAASIGMILEARGDRFINCIENVPAKIEDEKPEEHDYLEDFKLEPAPDGADKGKGKNKGKGKKGGGEQVLWCKVKKSVKDIGGLFDDFYNDIDD